MAGGVQRDFRCGRPCCLRGNPRPYYERCGRKRSSGGHRETPLMLPALNDFSTILQELLVARRAVADVLPLRLLMREPLLGNRPDRRMIETAATFRIRVVAENRLLQELLDLLRSWLASRDYPASAHAIMPL